MGDRPGSLQYLLVTGLWVEARVVVLQVVVDEAVRDHSEFSICLLTSPTPTLQPWKRRNPGASKQGLRIAPSTLPAQKTNAVL